MNTRTESDYFVVRLNGSFGLKNKSSTWIHFPVVKVFSLKKITKMEILNTLKTISYHLIVLFFLLGCESKNKPIKKTNSNRLLTNDLDSSEQIIEIASSFSNKKVEEFKKNINKNGDRFSFAMLIIHCRDNSDYKELNKYSLLMANKYNNSDACYEVFVSIIALNNNYRYSGIKDLSKIDEKAKNEALSYMKKGASLGNIDCMSTLSDIYRNGTGVEVDIKKSVELMEKIDKRIKDKLR